MDNAKSNCPKCFGHYMNPSIDCERCGGTGSLGPLPTFQTVSLDPVDPEPDPDMMLALNVVRPGEWSNHAFHRGEGTVGGMVYALDINTDEGVNVFHGQDGSGIHLTISVREPDIAGVRSVMTAVEPFLRRADWTAPTEEEPETPRDEAEAERCWARAQVIADRIRAELPGVTVNLRRFKISTHVVLEVTLDEDEIGSVTVDGRTVETISDDKLVEDVRFAAVDHLNMLAKMSDIMTERVDRLQLMPWAPARLEPRTGAPVACERCGWAGRDTLLVGDAANCPECGSTWEVTELPMPTLSSPERGETSTTANRVVLAPDHQGMRVSAKGMLGRLHTWLLDVRRPVGELWDSPDYQPGDVDEVPVNDLKTVWGLVEDELNGVTLSMLDQTLAHLEELATRWYGGDQTVVDEFLQLYCLGEDLRKQVKSRTPATVETGGELYPVAQATVGGAS